LLDDDLLQFLTLTVAGGLEAELQICRVRTATRSVNPADISPHGVFDGGTLKAEITKQNWRSSCVLPSRHGFKRIAAPQQKQRLNRRIAAAR
jgi:hypothetical protein